ncbi:MAG: sugar MFS transporter [Paraglaciecola sp.]|nr:sugar MFS transporter [Paraglaciecola sp.]NCT48632.1 sugar MFS transporter [Paraglaciecola sp.]
MANIQGVAATTTAVNSNPQHGHNFALISLTSLFFMWGFITALNDILIPHLKGIFSLNYTQAMLVQFCFFGAYFIVSMPAGFIVKKIGFQWGIGLGLLMAAAGCLLFIPSALWHTYWMFLGAFFVLAAGITILQVAANPLVTLLGNPLKASSRLTMTQAFNSLGTTIAPIIGGYLLFSSVQGSAEEEAQRVIGPYVILALMLVSLAIYFVKIKLPQQTQAETADIASSVNLSLLQNRHLVLGAVGIFVYVGAEVAIGSFLVNFLGEAHIANMPEAVAANYIAYYWGGAMVGRFIGALLMQKISPRTLLSFNCALSVALILTAVFGSGAVAMWAILAVGLCNSIMFPTIFSLAIHGLGENTSKGSGLLCLAIVGGAIVPVLQGMLADAVGLQLSFLLPAVCYVYIAYYGFAGAEPKQYTVA